MSIPSSQPSQPAFLTDGSITFETEISAGRTLQIFLEVHKKNQNWKVNGKMVLSSLETNNNTTRTHLIKPFTLNSGSTKWIGVWENIFEKKDVTENCAPEIPLQKLGTLANQTLLDLNAYANGVMIESNFLKEKIE